MLQEFARCVQIKTGNVFDVKHHQIRYVTVTVTVTVCDPLHDVELEHVLSTKSHLGALPISSIWQPKPLSPLAASQTTTAATPMMATSPTTLGLQCEMK